MILSSFTARNFKSIGAGGAGIDVAPITVLVGENGSGKSSLLEALALIAQRTRPNAKGDVVLAGEYVRYDSAEEIFHRGNPDESIELAFTLAPDADERAYYRKLANLQLDYVEAERLFAPSLRPETDSQQGATIRDIGRLVAGVGIAAKALSETEGLRVTTTLSTRRFVARTSVLAGRFPLWSHDAAGSSNTAVVLGGEPPRLFLSRTTLDQPLHDRLFSDASRSLNFGGRATSPEPTVFSGSPGFPSGTLRDLVYDFFSRTEEAIFAGLQRVYYIPAPRGRVPSAVSAGDSPEWIGTTSDQLARFMVKLQGVRDKSVFGQIQEWARRFGVHELNAASDGSATFHVDYQDDVLKAGLGVRGLGYGSTQVLPIIAQGFSAPEGSCLIIEEPEVSLHPNAQITLLDMFADFVRQNKRLLITTHSATLLMGLGRLLEGDHPLKPEQIAVYEASKTPAGSSFRPLKINDKGFIDGWVDSFGHAEKQILESWIKSVPEAS